MPRKPTSYMERHWPFYLGLGLPGLFFVVACIALMVAAAGNPIVAILVLPFVLVIIAITFLGTSLFLTRIFSALRGGAETLGVLTFISGSNIGFKLGMGLGLCLFFWFTPQIFNDPFSGQLSSKSSIIAQATLKALGFMGLAGMICSGLEDMVRRKMGVETKSGFSDQKTVPARPQPELVLPDRLKAIFANWPVRAAWLFTGLAFACSSLMLVFGQAGWQGTSFVILAVSYFLMFYVLRFYFKILDKVIRAMSRLYGWTVRVP